MKNIVITGANTGIGFATAKILVEQGHNVILACRNLDKANQACEKLKAIGKGKAEVVQLDLNSLAQVSKAADEISAKLDHLDVLINNAGMMSTTLQSTAEGFEQQIGVNYLAPSLLTLKLLPLLKKAPEGRIVNLASMMHALGRIKPEQFKANDVKRYNGVLSYGNSKLANLIFSNTLAKRLQGTNVTSNALHPGGVDSEIYRDLPKYQYLAMKLFLLHVNKPAKLISDMAVSPKWSKRNGEYVSLQTPAFKTKYAKDAKLGESLLSQTEQILQPYM